MARPFFRGRGSVLMNIGLMFLIGAIILAGYNLWKDKNAERASDEALSLLKMTSESDYRQDPERDMPGMLIEGASYVGRLDIPELSLQLPVIGKWSYANLDMAPCVYSGSAYKDDMVIAGHSYVSHFAYLDDLQEGDTLSFTDLGGNRFDYRVTGLELLPPESVERMTQPDGSWDMTLFSCNYSGRMRVTVRCEKISEEKISEEKI